MPDAAASTHRSIVGKVVADDQPPTHTMAWGRPTPISEEVKAQGFDKKEEEGAACSIRNISKKETARRYRISQFGLVMSILGCGFFVAKDKEIPRYYRLVMNIPFGLWIGLFLSAKAGI